MIRAFFAETSGAITVDWTVLAAAVVGLGVSSVAAVRTGTGALGDDIETSLSSASVANLNWAFAGDLVRQTFDNGDFSGWSVARAGTFGPWGATLGPFGFDTMSNPLTFDVNLTGANTNALIEFDMIIADTWDGVAGPSNPWTYAGGDTMTLMIDGQAISVEPFVHAGGPGHPGFTTAQTQARSSTVEVNGATYTVRMTPTSSLAQVGGSGSPDQRWRVQVEAINAPQSFEFGLSAALDQASHADEAFHLQNFSVRQN